MLMCMEEYVKPGPRNGSVGRAYLRCLKCNPMVGTTNLMLGVHDECYTP